MGSKKGYPKHSGLVKGKTDQNLFCRVSFLKFIARRVLHWQILAEHEIVISRAVAKCKLGMLQVSDPHRSIQLAKASRAT